LLLFLSLGVAIILTVRQWPDLETTVIKCIDFPSSNVRATEKPVDGTPDGPNSVALLDQLADEVGRLAQEALGSHDIHQIWTDKHCIRFRLGDGRTGDVELVVNWDVGREAT
jgi:hypothetical protein